jgi:hypothetical protein
MARATPVVIPLKVVAVPDELDPAALKAAAEAVDRSYDEDDPRAGDFDFVAEHAIKAYLGHLAEQAQRAIDVPDHHPV